MGSSWTFWHECVWPNRFYTTHDLHLLFGWPPTFLVKKVQVVVSFSVTPNFRYVVRTFLVVFALSNVRVRNRVKNHELVFHYEATMGHIKLSGKVCGPCVVTLPNQNTCKLGNSIFDNFKQFHMSVVQVWYWSKFSLVWESISPHLTNKIQPTSSFELLKS